MKGLPSQEYLNECFSYNKENGRLSWKVRPKSHFRTLQGWRKFNTVCPFKECIKMRNGYISIPTFFDGKQRHLIAHRVIWKMIHGVDPDQIDHINGLKYDNRIENLRSVSRAENAKNTKQYKNNKSGATGVCWVSGKWRAAINKDGRVINLGRFSDFEEAVACRKQAEVEYGYHPNHGRAGLTHPDCRI